MFKKTLLISVGLLLCVIGSVWALDASGQRYAQMLASGGVSSMQRAAEEIYNQHITDQELLDVAAEALSQNYTKNKGETYIDSMSWLCKAIGNSGNGRYKELLTNVSKNAGNSKLSKYCNKGADTLPAGGAGYQVGSVNLNLYKEGGAAVASATKAASAAKSAGGKVDFGLVKEGMSMQEVVSLIGDPTATTSKMTGNAFRPFNFRGKDVMRMYALYKGVGRLVLSNTNAYNSTYRIIEIVPDTTETGFP